MRLDVLTDQNFLIYAAGNYTNRACADNAEFREDLGRIRSLSRLFQRYARTGDLKDRLIINHIVVFYNCFEREAATRMLAMKLHEHLALLKPFLVLMGFWPERIGPFGSKKTVIVGSDVGMDQTIVNVLRRI